MIFHFIAREDVQDFKLVESLFDVLGFSDAVKLQGQANGAAETTRRIPARSSTCVTNAAPPR